MTTLHRAENPRALRLAAFSFQVNPARKWCTGSLLAYGTIDAKREDEMPSQEATALPSTEKPTVQDKLWLWGHDAGAHNEGWGLPQPSRITPTEAAFYLGESCAGCPDCMWQRRKTPLAACMPWPANWYLAIGRPPKRVPRTGHPRSHSE